MGDNHCPIIIKRKAFTFYLQNIEWSLVDGGNLDPNPTITELHLPAVHACIMQGIVAFFDIPSLFSAEFIFNRWKDLCRDKATDRQMSLSAVGVKDNYLSFARHN